MERKADVEAMETALHAKADVTIVSQNLESLNSDFNTLRTAINDTRASTFVVTLAACVGNQTNGRQSIFLFPVAYRWMNLIVCAAYRDRYGAQDSGSVHAAGYQGVGGRGEQS